MTPGRTLCRVASGMAPLALLLAACGDSGDAEAHWIDELVDTTAEQARAQQTQSAPSAGEDGLDLDALVADAQAQEPAIPAPSAWNELALADGVFADHTGGAVAYRHDVIEIPVEGFYGALEYKLQMNAGDSIVYRWTVEGLDDPSLLLSEFHGHTERVGDAPGDLMFYRRETGAQESGAMTAPFTGIHGWYLENSSDRDITVVLDVAGFYEIVPGQVGTIR